MGLRFKEQIFGNCFFVTTTFNNWKNYGYTDGVYKKLYDSMKLYLEKYDSRLFGYVFMPSHIHLILWIDGNRLSGFMRDFKKFVSQKAFKDIGINDKKIWMEGFDRIVIYSDEILLQKLNHIHRNPIKAGLVKNSEDWKWSSARDYLCDKVESNIVFCGWN